jgi:excisionase family DNA binding protein
VGASNTSSGAERQLKCSEAAAKLGVCERTLRRYMKADRIRFHRLPGGHFRIPESAIDEFWSEHDARRTRAAERSMQKSRAPRARRPRPASSQRRPALGCEPPDDYDLSRPRSTRCVRSSAEPASLFHPYGVS